MKVIRGLEPVDLEGVVLTIGNFDGVPRGHQAILAAGRRRAQATGTRLVAMTLDPHPLSILTPERMPAMLTPLHEKLTQLERAGADTTVVVPSTRELLAIPAPQFIEEVIVARFKPVALVEGASFGFGRHREGNVDSLRAVADRFGYEVQVIDPIRVALGGHPAAVISSSLIRQLLNSGTVDQAAECLGRPYTLFGPVVPGMGRGRKLGYPTLNIQIDRQLVPAEGVYAGACRIGQALHPAAISIGRTPTFEDHGEITEAYLLDFDGDLYGQSVALSFLDWIRPQERFPDSDALARQIADDVRQTRAAFQRSSGQPPLGTPPSL